MTQIRRLLIIGATLLSAGLQAPAPVWAGALNDAEALRGLHAAKGIFLIDVNNPERLVHVLTVVGATGADMARQGVKAPLVVVFVGRDVAFLTKDRRGIPYQERGAVARLQEGLKKLSARKVRMEACGVSLRGLGIEPGNVIPEVHPVANGYISAIGYQQQGYRLVPVY